MNRLSLLVLVLAGCAGAPPETLPGDAERYRPAPVVERAAEPPVEALTLERALDLADRLHPDLAQAQARADAADGRALQAGLFPNPSLIGRMESAPFEERTTRDADYLAGLSQRLPVGGRLGAAREVERLEAERLRKEREVKRFEVHSRARGAFATALFAAEVAKVQAELVGFARRAVEVARVRRQAGDVAAHDVARIEMEEARARLDEDKAKGLRELALVGLAAALGDPGLRVRSVSGALEAAFELPALESVLADLEGGPQAALARADVEAARSRVDLAKVERVPDVTLDLLYRRIGASDTDAFDVGVSIPLPLFDRNQGRLKEARAESRQAEARARATRGDAARRVREAHVRLGEAVGHARLVRDEILPRAETVRQAAEARHEQGDLSLADVLPIRRDYAAARLAHLDALREVMDAWGELRLFLRP
ncbi:MAG TPA: TolC family protein [Planctomycetota bacterium]